jgi:hypothetical protein
MESATSDGEHVQPGPLLPHANEANDPNNAEGYNRQLLGQLIHTQLKRRAFLLDLFGVKHAPDEELQRHLHLASWKKLHQTLFEYQSRSRHPCRDLEVKWGLSTRIPLIGFTHRSGPKFPCIQCTIVQQARHLPSPLGHLRAQKLERHKDLNPFDVRGSHL